MKIPIYIKHPLTQILLYVILDQIILWIVNQYKLIHLDVSIGISLRYLFYLFLLFSIIQSIILFFKNESKTFYLATLYLILSFVFFGLNSKLILIIILLSLICFLVSQIIYNNKKG
ncbi:hypothetical protein EDB96_3738 [Flavobacterium sp. S87F.05.LMB.W.Kidney.N]|nr:hypothetical protein EDB96_3738 [Flavobacterium sp. S87F.05.LMB.W.Kidney.N]